MGAAVRSEAWAAWPARPSRVAISPAVGGSTPAAAAKAASHSSAVIGPGPLSGGRDGVAGARLGADLADVEGLLAFALHTTTAHVVVAGRVVQDQRGAPRGR